MPKGCGTMVLAEGMRILSCTLFFTFAAAVVAQNMPPIDSSALHEFEAYVTAAQGQVSIDRDQRTWALSSGERVPIQRLITTGPDGYAHFDLKGGSSFDVYANSRVAFRQNASTAGDLLDVLAGRVRIHMNPGIGQAQQRIFCPVASVIAVNPATVAVALDEDDNARIDVLEGEVRIQHSLLPRSEPTLVRAVDAILVQKDQQISRRVDRGSLYRYAIKPLHDLFSAITPGRSARPSSSDPVEQKFLAWASPTDFVR